MPKRRKETQMEKINGIIISGKVYEIVETGTLITCKECAFQKRCREIDVPCADKFLTGNRTAIYRYSPELTDKLKGE